MERETAVVQERGGQRRTALRRKTDRRGGNRETLSHTKGTQNVPADRESAGEGATQAQNGRWRGAWCATHGKTTDKGAHAGLSPHQRNKRAARADRGARRGRGATYRRGVNASMTLEYFAKRSEKIKKPLVLHGFWGRVLPAEKMEAQSNQPTPGQWR